MIVKPAYILLCAYTCIRVANLQVVSGVFLDWQSSQEYRDRFPWWKRQLWKVASVVSDPSWAPSPAQTSQGSALKSPGSSNLDLATLAWAETFAIIHWNNDSWNTMWAWPAVTASFLGSYLCKNTSKEQSCNSESDSLFSGEKYLHFKGLLKKYRKVGPVTYRDFWTPLATHKEDRYITDKGWTNAGFDALGLDAYKKGGGGRFTVNQC